MNNWRWDNPCAFGDQVNCSNPQTTSSGKVKHTGEHFSWYGSNNYRAKIEPPRCQQYKPGDFLAVRPLNWDEIIGQDDDEENWADPRVPCSGRSRPSDGNGNDDGEGEDVTQGGERGTRKQKRTQDGKGKGTGNGKGKGKAMEEWKGKGNSKGKGIVKQTPVGDDISRAVALLLQKEMYEGANYSGYIWSRKHRPPCQVPQMMMLTVPSWMANITQNMILMWICAWKMMRTCWTALI